MTKKQVATILLIIVCSISLLFFVSEVMKYQQEKQSFHQLADQVEAQTTSPELYEKELAKPQILPQYKDLYAHNNDLAGWIKIEETKLNYPVMHTPNEVEYYLRRAFDKTDSLAGTPFIGYDCRLEPRSDNLLIYGHHMKNGTMFTTILSYKDKAFWVEHPVIIFNTLYKENKYEVMAVFYVTATVGNGHFEFYSFTDAKAEDDMQNFIDACKELSLYDTGVTAKSGDELITLSTCSYHAVNGRFVVVARKKQE